MNAITENDAADTEQQTTDEPQAIAPKRAPMERIAYDDEAGTCTIDGTTYAVSGLSPYIAEQLKLRGMALLLHRSSKPADTYAAFHAGRLTAREPKPTKGPSHWRKAVALALVEHTKKSDAPLTLDAAQARADGLSRADLAASRRDPLVVKHHAKLSGAVNGGSFLTSLSGG